LTILDDLKKERMQQYPENKGIVFDAFFISKFSDL